MGSPDFDAVIVGGGIAGGVLAGMLAREGRSVLLVEREASYRDRVRGEITFPCGVKDARAAGFDDGLRQAGAVELSSLLFHQGGSPADRKEWGDDTEAGAPAVGFSHPAMQETAFAWAGEQGARTLRPAKAIGYERGQFGRVSLVTDAGEIEVSARLVIGADGKTSAARRWTGGESAADPEHHRLGGVQVSGIRAGDPAANNVAGKPGMRVIWFANGVDRSRLYLMASREEIERSQAARSLAAMCGVAGQLMPPGALDEVEQIGPLAFFPNNDTWASVISGNGVTLVGDAAGSPDPTQGLGTSLAFHDVRTLGELLLSDDDWDRAADQYAAQRRQYFAALRAYDHWCTVVHMEAGLAGDRAREANARARQIDPTLGGWAFIETRGLDGLVPDDAGRRAYFAEA
jgi:menaquinone-9 beta-reductase